MKTRNQKRVLRIPAAVPCMAVAISLMYCSSCSTPPDQDDGLVGIIYHAAARPENGSLIGKKKAAPESQVAPMTVATAVRSDNAGNSATNKPAEGPPCYRISPGDVLAASYFARPPGETQEYRLDSLDVLTISVAGQETHSADVVVRPDGCISFFLVGDLRVRGKSVAQVRADVVAAMAKVMPAAEVTVILKESNALASEFLNTFEVIRTWVPLVSCRSGTMAR